MSEVPTLELTVKYFELVCKAGDPRSTAPQVSCYILLLLYCMIALLGKWNYKQSGGVIAAKNKPF